MHGHDAWPCNALHDTAILSNAWHCNVLHNTTILNNAWLCNYAMHDIAMCCMAMHITTIFLVSTLQYTWNCLIQILHHFVKLQYFGMTVFVTVTAALWSQLLSYN